MARSLTVCLVLVALLSVPLHADMSSVVRQAPVGSGLTQYIFNFTADPGWAIGGADVDVGVAGIHGAMHQVWPGGFLPTPTLTNAVYLGPQIAEDSHWMIYDNQIIASRPLTETTETLTGAFTISPDYRAASMDLLQIVLAEGQTVTYEFKVSQYNQISQSYTFSGTLGSVDASAELRGPGQIVVDMNASTQETAQYEVIVLSSGLGAIDGYQYAFEVDGAGVAFDFTATENATDALAANGSAVPLYLLYDDSTGCWAQSFDGNANTILASDLSNSGSTYNPNARQSLGLLTVRITDDAAAVGMHTISAIVNGGEPMSMLTDLGLGLEIPLQIAPIQFEVVPVPEPLTLSLLGLGFVALRRRRR